MAAATEAATVVTISLSFIGQVVIRQMSAYDFVKSSSWGLLFILILILIPNDVQLEFELKPANYRLTPYMSFEVLENCVI